MKKQEQLYNLIKSLTKAEKAYIKKFSRRYAIGVNKDNIRLLDAIDRQKEYDEKKIKRKLNHTSLVTYFTQSKYNLQKLILRSLADLHSKNHTEFDIMNIIHSVNILFDKGLYDVALSLIKKGKEIALENEKYTFLTELLLQEDRIKSKGRNPKQIDEFHKRFSSDISKYAELIINQANVRTAIEKIIKFETLYGTQIKQQELHELDAIFFSELKEYESKPLSPVAKIQLLEGIQLYYRLKGDLIQCSAYSAKAVRFIEEKKRLPRRLVFYYVYIMHNHLIQSLALSRMDEFDRYVEKIKNIPLQYPEYNTEELQLAIFHTRHIELDKYISTGEFSKGVLHLRDIEIKLKRFEKKSSVVITFVTLLNIAYVYLGAGEYKQALQILTRVLNESYKVRMDGQLSARLMNIIIHYEIGNEEIIDSLVSSTRYFLKKHSGISRSEKLILDFFSSKKIKDGLEKNTEMVNKIKKQLELLETDPTERNIFKGFNFLLWLESKLTGKSLEAVSQENWRKKIKEMDASVKVSKPESTLKN